MPISQRPTRRDATKQFCRVGSGGVKVRMSTLRDRWNSYKNRSAFKHIYVGLVLFYNSGDFDVHLIFPIFLP